jgi:hypothetical protein
MPDRKRAGPDHDYSGITPAAILCEFFTFFTASAQLQGGPALTPNIESKLSGKSCTRIPRDGQCGRRRFAQASSGPNLTGCGASGYGKAAQKTGTFLYSSLWIHVLKCYQFRIKKVSSTRWLLEIIHIKTLRLPRIYGRSLKRPWWKFTSQI